MSARILSALGILSSDVPTGNLVWVDAINGIDALAVRGRMTIPFKTLGAAKAAASSGDTIVVLPGIYNENNLLKTGVNWHFLPGAKVIYSDSDDAGIFDTSAAGTNGAVTSTITGWGEFQVSNALSSGHVVYSSASNSDLLIQAKRMAANSAVCVKTANAAGKLKLHVTDDITSSNGTAVQIGGTALSTNENIIRAFKLNSGVGPGLVVTGGNIDVAVEYIYSSAASGVSITGGSDSKIIIKAYEISAAPVASAYGVHYSASSNPTLTILGARIVSTHNDASGHALYISAGGNNCIRLAGSVLLSPHAGSKSIAAVSANTTVQLHGMSIGQQIRSTNVVVVPSGAWIDTVTIS